MALGSHLFPPWEGIRVRYHHTIASGEKNSASAVNCMFALRGWWRWSNGRLFWWTPKSTRVSNHPSWSWVTDWLWALKVIAIVCRDVGRAERVVFAIPTPDCGRLRRLVSRHRHPTSPACAYDVPIPSSAPHEESSLKWLSFVRCEQVGLGEWVNIPVTVTQPAAQRPLPTWTSYVHIRSLKARFEPTLGRFVSYLSCSFSLILLSSRFSLSSCSKTSSL
jgi:hypothetical protein